MYKIMLILGVSLSVYDLPDQLHLESGKQATIRILSNS